LNITQTTQSQELQGYLFWLQ